MKNNYPDFHYDIVKDLTDGKFILYSDKLYQAVKTKEKFYVEFFKATFDFDLQIEAEFMYLLSDNTDEKTSRDMMIFFSILSLAINDEGKNFMRELDESYFTLEEIDNYFNNALAWQRIIEEHNPISTSSEREKLANKMRARNIVEGKTDGKFRFTKAHKIFLNFALELTEQE